MHPLFPAHLIADFLLQPHWLVAWKERRVNGLLFHAAIHGFVLTFLLVPTTVRDVFIIALLAVIHSAIDYAKIQARNHRPLTRTLVSGPGFLLDQYAHLFVLIGGAIVLPSPLSFWHSEIGQGILSLLIFFSFGIGLWNLSKKTNLRQWVATAGVLAFVFISYLIPTKLLGTAACFSP